jgi:hypothetical protein
MNIPFSVMVGLFRKGSEEMSIIQLVVGGLWADLRVTPATPPFPSRETARSLPQKITVRLPLPFFEMEIQMDESRVTLV